MRPFEKAFCGMSAIPELPWISSRGTDIPPRWIRLLAMPLRQGSGCAHMDWKRQRSSAMSGIILSRCQSSGQNTARRAANIFSRNCLRSRRAGLALPSWHPASSRCRIPLSLPATIMMRSPAPAGAECLISTEFPSRRSIVLSLLTLSIAWAAR